MKNNLTALGALIGGLTSIPLIALLYLGEQVMGLAFVPFDIFDWLARVLPGSLITMGIDSIVGVVTTFGLGATDSSAKQIEQSLAIALFIVGAIVLGALIGYALQRQPGRGVQNGMIFGAIAFLVVMSIEAWFGVNAELWRNLLWLAILLIGWGVVVGKALEILPAPATDVASHQRRVVLSEIAGGSLLLALAGWGIARFFAPPRRASGAGQPLSNLNNATPAAESGAVAQTTVQSTGTPASATPAPSATLTMRERVEAAPGTRPELTANQDFYRIDINTVPPQVDETSWMLEVKGLFDNAHSLTLPDLMRFPAITQPITISCISNPIGGDLISTSKWTGVRLRDLLKELGMRPEAKELAVQAVDGFYESVAMADMMDPRTLLVYGMNGETLPVEHGFPLRIYIPNRYGMKQPKWISSIEAIDHLGPGYWVDRGWSAEAHPRVISIIDTVAVDAETTEQAIPVGGIAWAGDRGIQKVEVQVDEEDWQAAVLRTPSLSDLTWIQWRYDWPGQNGKHTFRVRATDGTGQLQIGDRSGVRPDGATGYHTVTATISL